MAVITPVVTPVYGFGNLDGYQVVWGPMAAGDVGLAVGSTIGTGANAIGAPGGGFMSGNADKTVQVVGTYGAGGSVAVEGNLDGLANWFALSDPQGNLIAITAVTNPIKVIEEAVVQVRPHITGGDGTTALTVTMFLRKTQMS